MGRCVGARGGVFRWNGTCGDLEGGSADGYVCGGHVGGIRSDVAGVSVSELTVFVVSPALDRPADQHRAVVAVPGGYFPHVATEWHICWRHLSWQDAQSQCVPVSQLSKGTSAPAAHSPIDSCGEFIMYQDAGVRLPGHDGAWPTRALPLACNCRHISYRVLASALCSDFGIE